MRLCWTNRVFLGESLLKAPAPTEHFPEVVVITLVWLQPIGFGRQHNQSFEHARVTLLAVLGRFR